MVKIKMPEGAKYIIEKLEESGYEAYAVGGCVRDSLMGAEPKDWDICTPALPHETMQVFEGHHIIETGLHHGTITLMLEGEPYEITTFRVDGKYTDNRRPDTVKFVSVLKRDLARRDFTINAMAYAPKTGIVDYYGGPDDLKNKKIKCVGNPAKRFREDALRIMRALRFASVLGFSIEDSTAQAMHEGRKLLGNIAPERISAELNMLLCGNFVIDVISQHIEVIGEVIPELMPMAGFDQCNPNHSHDVLTHTLLCVKNAPKDITMRLTMLLHDIGKPHCFTQSDDGIGHFFGHAGLGAGMAKEVLTRLKYDNGTKSTVTELVALHDCEISGSRQIKRMLNKIGEPRLRQLIEVNRADAMTKTDKCQKRDLAAIEKASSLLNQIVEQRQCVSLKDLAVNGRDLMGVGIKDGVTIGKVLGRLLEKVIDEQAANERETLLRLAEKETV